MSSRAEKAIEATRQRKVGPIYACIDAGNYKGALKLCEKKDLADWDIVLALKAHSLERSGKSSEALAINRAVKLRKPMDDSVLSTLALNFKMLDCEEEATECYENALAVEPGNLTMAQEVFFSHVRRFAFAKQQQVAMKLVKQLPQQIHLVCWTATAALLARREDPKTPPSMLLLAERMVKRSLDGRVGQRPSAEEFRLLVALLREQGKLDEALEAVQAHAAGEPPLGEASASEASKITDQSTLESAGVPSEFLMLPSSERLAMEAELLTRLGKYGEALEALQRLSAFDPEEWSHHSKRNALLFPEGQAAEGQTDEEAVARWRAAAVAKARAEAWERQSEAPKSRAAFLNECDLLKRLLASAKGKGAKGAFAGSSVALPEAWRHDGEGKGEVTVAGALRGRVLAYLGRFGSKPCCFIDLKPFLRVLAPFEAARLEEGGELEGGSLVAELDKRLRAPHTDAKAEVAARIDALHRYMCAAQCKRFLTSPPPAAPPAASNSSSSRPQSELLSESLEAADDYAAVYALTLDVNDGAKGGQREVQHGDDLALLAAQLLLEASSLVVEEPPSDAASAAGHSKANELLLDAASLLEFALGHSPYSAHLKVLLLEAYDKLGAFEAGVRLFNQLGVKHVQADTLSYLVTGPCVRSGLLAEASRQCGEVLRFHRAARRDAGDYSVKALESGNYSKAVEIAEFQRDKLDASASLALAQALKPGLALAQSNHTLPEARALLAEANARKDAPALWTREAVAKLSLNWDLDVKLHWENRSPEEGEVKKALSLELRSRAALVRLLHHALESSAPNLASELPHLNAAAAEAEAAAAGGAGAAGALVCGLATKAEALGLKACLHLFQAILAKLSSSRDSLGKAESAAQVEEGPAAPAAALPPLPPSTLEASLSAAASVVDSLAPLLGLGDLPTFSAASGGSAAGAAVKAWANGLGLPPAAAASLCDFFCDELGASEVPDLANLDAPQRRKAVALASKEKADAAAGERVGRALEALGEAPVSGGWLAGACTLVEVFLPAACLALQQLGVGGGAAAGGKKAKKKKAALAAPVSPALARCHASVHAVASALAQRLECLGLVSVQRAKARALDSPKALEALPGLGQSEALSVAKAKVLANVGSSQALSAERLLPILRAKLQALGAPNS